MTTSTDRRTPPRPTVGMTERTSTQSVLERPVGPSTDAPASTPSRTRRPVWLGWLAALVAVAALAIVGATALSGGDADQRIEASMASPELATTPGTSILDGYWNPYTREWTPTQTINTTPATDGYWNPYTREWTPTQTINTTPATDGYWNPYTREWVPVED